MCKFVTSFHHQNNKYSNETFDKISIMSSKVLWEIGHLGGHFKKAYELLNIRALKFSPVNKMHIFQCMDKIFSVEFQREPLKFHTKYLAHTLKDTIFIRH